MQKYDHPDEASQGSDTASPTSPPVVSSARIVYCTSCGCHLEQLCIGEPCPNCQVPVGAAAQTNAKTDGRSIAALVLGISTFVGCMFYGLPGIICGILAIHFAGKVKRDVEAGDVHPSSMGLATAGRICGIVGLCLSIVYMLASIAWFIYFFTYMTP